MNELITEIGYDPGPANVKLPPILEQFLKTLPAHSCSEGPDAAKLFVYHDGKQFNVRCHLLNCYAERVAPEVITTVLNGARVSLLEPMPLPICEDSDRGMHALSAIVLAPVVDYQSIDEWSSDAVEAAAYERARQLGRLDPITRAGVKLYYRREDPHAALNGAIRGFREAGVTLILMVIDKPEDWHEPLSFYAARGEVGTAIYSAYLPDNCDCHQGSHVLSWWCPIHGRMNRQAPQRL